MPLYVFAAITIFRVRGERRDETRSSTSWLLRGYIGAIKANDKSKAV